MHCSYYDAHVCRSCRWIELPYADQLAAKQARVLSALPPMPWRDPVASPEEGFRNKAKMVVGGTVDEPTLGILDPRGRGVDLRECGLHDPRLRAALPVLAELVRAARLTPYSVPDRRGELKHVLVTVAPSGELMVRFVLRSTEAVPRLRKHLPGLLASLPVAVVSVNLQPAHKAVLEGPEEIALHGDTLTMRVNDLDLHLRPQSFFQTNTAVAARLYHEATGLVASVGPASVWDLYCGVGGFGLHVAAPGRTVVGVESSEQAIESATLTAADLGLAATFLAGDATAYALASAEVPELVIVNPPRRGIGRDLATWLEASSVRHVVYSSCNVDTLARDLTSMTSLRPVSAQLLDMFPHTDHHEVLVLLSRG
ncbi:23S rRNA (uracil(747)-C(5))-methyltransferase RlmC [Nocardioides sp. CER19]|uniref:23S rRNA (uracil(747)-C(5))-methyltransferase RlmC n=1 Tax=Nocardioides sp. CER19 TaxID=3038538 RepID=UPI002448AFCF|nr:23S rRNA (uracil(747)-C(5))-methyltransferase RlmC [Nocardioides sp. CER19]MDH2414501.1 23S rRNA (uracil(747)-C(5))-methyltransferase RlmC [Nocardioides sp. CER19]